MCSGGARFIIGEAAKYASQRRQFGRPIGEFGSVRNKLSEMAVRQYAVESMLYRMAGSLDDALDARTDSASLLAALEEHAIEASIVKVAGSEMLDYVVDENVQIHGGNGFVRDYPAERYYRDARVNRIFEGTNEINRLLIPAMLLRRRPDLAGDADAPDTPLGAMKSAARTILATAASTYGKALGEKQEVLSLAADILIDVYAADSVTARASATGDSLHNAAAAIYVNDACGRVELAARTALAGMLNEDTVQSAAVQLRASFTLPVLNTIPLRNQVAAAVLARGKYPFA
jgi:alkylation response protein AidB-like acyl-CoA dehydrogenase